MPGWYVSRQQGQAYDVLVAGFEGARFLRVLRHEVQFEVRHRSTWHHHIQSCTVERVPFSSVEGPSSYLPMTGPASRTTIDIQTWEERTLGPVVEYCGETPRGNFVSHIRVNVLTPKWLMGHGILGTDGFPFRPNVSPCNASAVFCFGFWN